MGLSKKESSSRSDAETRAWLRLLVSGLDIESTSRVARAVSSPGALFESSAAELAERFSLPPSKAEQLRADPKTKTIDGHLRAMDQHGIRLIMVGDADYPRNLFEMRTPPAGIFVKGTLAEEDRLSVGIVGPRNPTDYGIQVTEWLAREFAPMLTVVSGAAMGVDTAAHAATISSGGRTLAVLGCGIDVDYPARNTALRAKIAAEGGALVSIFPPGTSPLRGHFPLRNFILAGLSLAVVVVEAGEKSGALTTARAAGEEGRPVYAVPGDITRKNSAGSNALLRDGAGVLTCPQDLLRDLEPMLTGELQLLRARKRSARHEAPAANAPASARHDPTHHPILDLIRHEPISLDDLMDRLVLERLTVGELSTALLMLEMEGRIRQMAGRMYVMAL